MVAFYVLSAPVGKYDIGDVRAVKITGAQNQRQLYTVFIWECVSMCLQMSHKEQISTEVLEIDFPPLKRNFGAYI